MVQKIKEILKYIFSAGWISTNILQWFRASNRMGWIRGHGFRYHPSAQCDFGCIHIRCERHNHAVLCSILVACNAIPERGWA